MSSPIERPAKRVRQACEPCRRKKARCSGEKPVCSHCSRLRQACIYADERHENGPSLRSASPTPQPRTSRQSTTHDRILEDRLRSVEAQLAEVITNQDSVRRSASSQVPEVMSEPSRASGNINPSETRLPSWEVIQTAAETYLLYCDCQPLPLFHRSTFIQTLRSRDGEVIFSLLALAARFLEDPALRASQVSSVHEYMEAARTIVSKKVFDGVVELSTIQTLCLLSLVDFTEGTTRRASMHSSLAMSLAHNAGLTAESHSVLSGHDKEERRRCFWSLFLLKRLHGADFMVLDLSTDDNNPRYPEITRSPLSPAQPINEPIPTGAALEVPKDKGVIAYAIQLSEVWFKITRYAWRREIRNALPPWSPESEYSIILAQQMDFETRVPYSYRFKPSKFSQRSAEELNTARDYWGPWLLIQFLYHTNLCLLNHPLLLSLRLLSFKGVIPEIFLQHTSDLLSSHTSWIINFIDMLESKPYKVTDPFLAHCVAIVATIYLQESFVDDLSRRHEKQQNFDKCLGFIRGFGTEWPHVGRIADKLEGLSRTVSSTYVASDEPTRKNRKLLIDLGQFFEILEYSSSSEIAGSARQLFGPSLHSSFRASRTEMAQTSILPEPTRVERQEFGTPTSATILDNHTGLSDFGQSSSFEIAAPFQFSDDELAVLAGNFFHPRPDVDGNANWWNMGNFR
ncbi:C6 transcription factor [Venustampulla echinocandica]|uniref:C6 transcription factor n=1 Tax=Venustampulla echinocandica TaxID=2656787 RepID=A0A370TLF9_9HELO|nr:C6 transcription factor [Venustampulla echinocandica]RDL36372.1 C6 transcription factor [Venustampulla echinocandica]